MDFNMSIRDVAATIAKAEKYFASVLMTFRISEEEDKKAVVLFKDNSNKVKGALTTDTIFVDRFVENMFGDFIENDDFQLSRFKKRNEEGGLGIDDAVFEKWRGLGLLFDDETASLITEKPLAEFLGVSAEECFGHVFFINGQSILQVNIQPDVGAHEGWKNNKISGRYSIYWREKGVTIQKLQEWAKELCLAQRSKGCKQITEPIRVFALYAHFRNGEWHHKHMAWHLFANDSNLDEYDQQYQRIHEQFVANEQIHIGFAQYNVDDLSDFAIEGNLLSEDGREKDEPQNLCLNFQVPIFRWDLMRKICRETIMAPGVTISDAAIDTMLWLARQRIEEFYDRP
jgi:hypothetical protein